MPEFFVTIAGHRLEPLADLATTRSQLLSAVRDGGDFVEFRDGARLVSVLVTPFTGVSVHLPRETEEVHAEAAGAGAGAVPVEAMFPSFDSYENYGI